MANGERCKNCGCQETGHLYPEYADPEQPPCEFFDSEVEHHRLCIGSAPDRMFVGGVTYCGGDCLRFLQWHNKLRRREARYPINHSVLMLTPYGVIDIGG